MSDELNSELKFIFNSYRSLLVIIDKTETSCTSKELTDSKDVAVHDEAIKMDNEVENELVITFLSLYL